MIRIAAIDDEPQALEILRHYVEKIDDLKWTYQNTDAVAALSWLKTHPGEVDLLLLDIEMPDLNGLDLLQLLSQKVPCILTTAYDQYALKSYNYHCIDYLLKPIPFARFLQAIEKYRGYFENPKNGDEGNSMTKISFYTGSENILLSSEEIRYIEADGNYCTLHANEKQYMLAYTLKNLISELPQQFFQVHRSYVINMDRLNATDSTTVTIRDKKIPIGRKYRQSFREAFENRFS